MRTLRHTVKIAGIAAAVLLLAGGAAAQIPTPNLFVSCSGNNSIVEVSPDGTVTPFASGLDAPADVAFDSAGSLFEADEGSGNVYEFVKNGGTLSTTPILYASGLDEPYGLAFGAAGLYVSEYGNGDIVRITDGTVNFFVSGLAGPEGLAYETPGLGELYVAEQQEGFVSEISATTGTRTNLATGLSSPSGVVAAGAKIVYVTDQGANNIEELVSPPLTLVSGLDDPSGIAEFENKFYEADTGSGDINIIEPVVGRIPVETTLVTGLDGPVGLAFQPVPEPAGWALLAVGGIVFAGLRRMSAAEPRA